MLMVSTDALEFTLEARLTGCPSWASSASARGADGGGETSGAPIGGKRGMRCAIEACWLGCCAAALATATFAAAVAAAALAALCALSG